MFCCAIEQEKYLNQINSRVKKYHKYKNKICEKRMHYFTLQIILSKIIKFHFKRNSCAKKNEYNEIDYTKKKVINESKQYHIQNEILKKKMYLIGGNNNIKSSFWLRCVTHSDKSCSI